MRLHLITLGIAALTMLHVAPAGAQAPAAFFEENCAPCHTIGGGAKGAPDLKDVSKRRDRGWLLRFLLNPDAFASDPAVVRMVKESDGLTMPAAEGLTREMAQGLLALIDERSRTPATIQPAPPVDAVTPADVQRGRDLFSGNLRLSSAGPPCIACHDAPGIRSAGGRLGPNLSGVHARLGGRRGLTAWLGATPTPMMRAVYRPAPLSADESRVLAAFLDDSSPRYAGASAPRLLISGGAAGAAAVLLVAGVAGRHRLRAVRRPLVTRKSGGPR